MANRGLTATTTLMLAFILTVVSTFCEDAPQPSPTYDAPGPHSIAFLEFADLKDARRGNRSVPLKVHYPTDQKDCPLVIMSHGGGGNWDANIYQAQHLASHGYVVICTEHVFSNTRRIKYYMSAKGGSRRFLEALHRTTTDPRTVLERPRDVSFAIDQAILWNKEHKELAGRINTEKIGMMGHSFGAYTTLVVCGARPILDYLDPTVGEGTGLAEDLSDKRVTFGFPMSPQSPGGTFFSERSFKTIDRPLVCLTGSRDSQKGSDGGIMRPRTRWKTFELLPEGQKYFVWLVNADHLAFSDSPRAFVLPSRARADAQQISKALMVVSCDYFLKGDQTASKYLTETYTRTLLGETITDLTWVEK